MSDWDSFAAGLLQPATRQRRPVQVSLRTVRNAIDNALMAATWHELEIILADELDLPWTHDTFPGRDAHQARADRRLHLRPIRNLSELEHLEKIVGHRNLCRS